MAQKPNGFVSTKINQPTKYSLMNALFGNYDAKEKKSTWLCNDRQLLSKFSLQTKASFVSKVMYSDTATDTNGKKEFLALISSSPADDFNCHVCSPILECVVFNKQSNSWTLNYRSNFDQSGNFGAPPHFDVKKIGKSSTGFLFYEGSTGQGITEEGLSLYAYINGSFKKILGIKDSGGDNSGECDSTKPNNCYTYNTTFNLIETNNKPRYNIKLNKKGTIIKDQKLVTIDITDTYQFVNGVYEKVK